MTHEEYIECLICGYEFSQEMIELDRDFAIELHNRIHNGEFK